MQQLYANATFISVFTISKLDVLSLAGTSIRVSDETYKIIIKTRGILEQLFMQKLSLDDTMYLSSRLVSFIYETFRKLEARGRIKIVEVEDGKLSLEGLENVRGIMPEIISEIMEIKGKLAEKETSQLSATAEG